MGQMPLLLSSEDSRELRLLREVPECADETDWRRDAGWLGHVWGFWYGEAMGAFVYGRDGA